MVDFQVRSAVRADVPSLFGLIQALADYENLSQQVIGSPEQLAQHLFDDQPYASVLVSVVLVDGVETVTGMALYFYNYSTFRTQPGLYLEDLFVLEAYRGQGMGKALLKSLAVIAVEKGCGRFEWSVLDWNAPSIAFYQHMGAEVLPDWRICRVAGEALTRLSQGSET
ncbi:GNAT family N-acetyltransferase [filamentous cyanobacterium LEGE 11480]|uniref:GNAT family N-acetyltransferase n=1 Tax=Romeriopsis navalis LEGE 11480 TaxID=2777977 RepID=A0A928VQ15_9CYAN|nr:GNAT family N-acetyltransferase [Romeriopsis navalis]MBE9031703.1 GNAT family N-acetyltransferase [Romeriopsis navalis LEGE 11480]